MTKEKNPFAREITNSKLSDSFISGSNSMSDYANEEEEKTRLNNCFNTYNKGLKTSNLFEDFKNPA